MDPPTLNKRIVELTENQGIIFLDEIDKIIEPKEGRSGLVSREGVQRDLLPLVEGTVITTKFGPINTDHILFIAAGAFHRATPSDLMPEFQGRFPIRVELKDLTTEDFISILTKTRNSLITQQIALLKTDGVVLSFTKDAIKCMAEYATVLNTRQANLGARRLHTIVTALLKEVSFNSPDKMKTNKVRVNKNFVEKVLKDIVKDEDLSKYVL
jgi:ATP-dependent HslUV protease ATP-binding subunit HslU